MPEPHSDVVYCLSNGAQTYVGVTNDMRRRLRQHNGELKGGARYTTLNKYRGTLGCWVLAFLVTGFTKRSDALKLEWRLHGHLPKLPRARRNPYRTAKVPEARRAWALQRVLSLERITKTATPTARLALRVYWRDEALYQCVTKPVLTSWPPGVRHHLARTRQ